MRYGLCVLLVLLIVSSPELAWGRSEQHRYREVERLRKQWQREAERLDKLKRQRRYPHFQLDVF